jgi:hypothetical protein
MLKDCCYGTENKINEKSPSAEMRGGVGNKKRRSRVRSYCCVTEILVSGKGKEEEERIG